MLDNLLDIEIAYSLLKTGDDSAKDPLDLHYEKLKTDIQVLLTNFCSIFLLMISPQISDNFITE
jgi:hypothetical protein